MLAIGAGGLDVALAMTGEPFPTIMPTILGVRLNGALPDWVSAKDVILEMLRRRGVSGGVGKIIEYFGPGLQCLRAMDRHVIANMGAELGATTTVFPSDEETRRFLERQGRAVDWRELVADPGCRYDDEDEIDLSQLEPMIATPSSPGNVVKVHDIEGADIYQSYIGSSANPGWRDFAIAAEIVRGRSVASGISLRRQSHLAANPTDADRRWAPRFAGGRRRPHSSNRLQWLHRHGAGARGRAKLAAHHTAQLPRPVWDRRRFGFSLLTGNSRRLRALRTHY
jgi:aconitate hydratase